jgi:signal transduction histidine kinase
MRKTTITQRWLINSLGVIFMILLGILIAFSIFIRNYYYSGTKQYLSSRMNMVASLLQRYYTDNETNFSSEVRAIIENWSEKDKIELMAINSSGKIVITSSGFSPSDNLSMKDFYDAVNSGSSGYYVGKLTSGETIMAFTILTPENSSEFSAVRAVTSLDAINNHIYQTILAVAAVCAVILFLMSFSGLYFVKSIVIPVRQLGSAARRYAQGDFSVRMLKKNDDEIGELCDIINHMADELSMSESMKNEFISSVSHELRTPLTAIKGWAETIGAMPEDTVSVTKGMKVISNETERLSQMVEDLLDFSRVQNGRFTLNKDTIDILAELGDAVLMYTEKAKADNIAVVYDEPDMLPFIYGDKNRLRQVFINVIDNAIKYSDKGGLVSIQASMKDENHIQIDISDKGCGISPDDLPKIKTKFYKANYSRRGSGIGLAVADEIITMHDGQLNVYSEQGVGTTVTIILPVKSSVKGV